MKKIAIFTLLLLSSCTYENKFERDVWINNSALFESYPRQRMTKDLLQNILKKGMGKDEIISLLGTPEIDEIQCRIPKGIRMPDSLRSDYPKGKPKPVELIAYEVEIYNKWRQQNCKKDTFLLYRVYVWIDPNYLVVKLNGSGKATDFWMEQH